VTKRKGNGKGDNNNARRINDNANARAMAIPQVQEQISALRACWKLLSPQQRGEQLSDLHCIGCSERGLAREPLKNYPIHNCRG
jgi:hypothetical protein